MAIEIPSGLANLLHGLTGMKWPEANEDQLRAVGDLYRSAASDFDQLADLMTELTSDIKQNFEGETADQFVTEMKDFISGDDYLGTAKKTTSDLAQFADDTANEIEYMKWMTLGTLVQLAAELAFFAATSWINWGAAAEAAAAQAWTRVVLKVLRNKVVSFLLQHFAIGLVSAVAMDRIIQKIQGSQGNRASMDRQLLLQSVEFAGISAGLGIVLGPLGNMLGGGLGKLLGKDFRNDLGRALNKVVPKNIKPASGGDFRDFGQDLGHTIGDHGGVLPAGFGKDARGPQKGFVKEHSDGSGKHLVKDPAAVEAFALDIGEAFSRNLGGKLGPAEGARAVGERFGRTFATGWGNRSLTDLKHLLSKQLENDNKLLTTGLTAQDVTALSHGVPEAVVEQMAKSSGIDWNRQLVHLGATSAVGGLNMTLTAGFYTMLFEPDHKFVTDGWAFAGGAGMAIVSHGGHGVISGVRQMWAVRNTPNFTRWGNPDHQSLFGKGLFFADPTGGKPTGPPPAPGGNAAQGADVSATGGDASPITTRTSSSDPDSSTDHDRHRDRSGTPPAPGTASTEDPGVGHETVQPTGHASHMHAPPERGVRTQSRPAPQTQNDNGPAPVRRPGGVATEGGGERADGQEQSGPDQSDKTGTPELTADHQEMYAPALGEGDASTEWLLGTGSESGHSTVSLPSSTSSGESDYTRPAVRHADAGGGYPMSRVGHDASRSAADGAPEPDRTPQDENAQLGTPRGEGPAADRKDHVLTPGRDSGAPVSAPDEAGRSLVRDGSGHVVESVFVGGSSHESRGETVGDGILGAGEVRTDRWIPGASGGSDRAGAFEFAVGEDGKPKVHRPDDSGERTDVAYSWQWHSGETPVGDVLRITRRIHLRTDGVRDAEIDELKEKLLRAVDQQVNKPVYRLPALQPEEVTGPKLPGPVLHLSVDFVDRPEAAHSVVEVRAGLPPVPRAMTQGTWYAGADPVAGIHELIHGLGVRDDQAGPGVLLTPGGRVDQQLTDGHASLMGSFSHTPDPQHFVLTADHLTQIAVVFAPHVHRGTLTARPGHVTEQAHVPDRHTPDRQPAVDYPRAHTNDHDRRADSGIQPATTASPSLSTQRMRDHFSSHVVSFREGSKILEADSKKKLDSFMEQVKNKLDDNLHDMNDVAQLEFKVTGWGNGRSSAEETGRERADEVVRFLDPQLRDDKWQNFKCRLDALSGGSDDPGGTFSNNLKDRRRTAKVEVFLHYVKEDHRMKSENSPQRQQLVGLSPELVAKFAERNVVIETQFAYTAQVPASDGLPRVSGNRPKTEAQVVRVRWGKLKAGEMGVLRYRTDQNLLFRWEKKRTGSDYSTIFEKGFVPLGNIYPTLIQYVRGGGPTIYVSTTRSSRKQHLVGWGGDYRYLIDAPGGIDAAVSLNEASLTVAEEEVTFPGGIRPEYIVGVELVNGIELDESTGRYADTVKFVPNPNYVPHHRLTRHQGDDGEALLRQVGPSGTHRDSPHGHGTHGRAPFPPGSGAPAARRKYREAGSVPGHAGPGSSESAVSLPSEPVRNSQDRETGFPGIYVRWDPTVDPTFFHTVKEQLTKLASQPIGRNLLESIGAGTATSNLENGQLAKVKIERVGAGTMLDRGPEFKPPHAGNEAEFINSDSATTKEMGTHSVIRYNPNAWETIDGLRPPFLGLAHELIHVQRHLYGLSHTSSAEDEAQVVGFGEFRQLEFTENKIRDEHHLEPRITYSGIVPSDRDESGSGLRTGGDYKKKGPISVGESARLHSAPEALRTGQPELGGRGKTIPRDVGESTPADSLLTQFGRILSPIPESPSPAGDNNLQEAAQTQSDIESPASAGSTKQLGVVAQSGSGGDEVLSGSVGMPVLGRVPRSDGAPPDARRHDGALTGRMGQALIPGREPDAASGVEGGNDKERTPDVEAGKGRGRASGPSAEGPAKQHVPEAVGELKEVWDGFEVADEASTPAVQRWEPLDRHYGLLQEVAHEPVPGSVADAAHEELPGPAPIVTEEREPLAGTRADLSAGGQEFGSPLGRLAPYRASGPAEHLDAGSGALDKGKSVARDDSGTGVRETVGSEAVPMEAGEPVQDKLIDQALAFFGGAVQRYEDATRAFDVAAERFTNSDEGSSSGPVVERERAGEEVQTAADDFLAAVDVLRDVGIDVRELEITDEDLLARPRMPGGGGLRQMLDTLGIKRGRDREHNRRPTRTADLPASASDLQRIKYATEAMVFERELARYLLDRPEAIAAARDAAKLIWEYIDARAPEFLPLLGTKDPHQAGAVGNDPLRLQDVVTGGNIRELVQVLVQATYSKVLNKWFSPPPERLPENVAERKFKLTNAYPDESPVDVPDVRPPLSIAEVSRGHFDGNRIIWRRGGDVYSFPLKAPLQQRAQATGGLVAAGTSGTAPWVMETVRRIVDATHGATLDFHELRLALIANMVYHGHHTLHEVMRGVALWDARQGNRYGLDYVDGWSRYRHLLPLTEAELRQNVASNGLFPDEIALGLHPQSDGAPGADGLTLLRAHGVDAEKWAVELQRLSTKTPPTSFSTRNPDFPQSPLEAWSRHWAARLNTDLARERAEEFGDAGRRSEGSEDAAGSWERAESEYQQSLRQEHEDRETVSSWGLDTSSLDRHFGNWLGQQTRAPSTASQPAREVEPSPAGERGGDGLGAAAQSGSGGDGALSETGGPDGVPVPDRVALGEDIQLNTPPHEGSPADRTDQVLNPRRQSGPPAGVGVGVGNGKGRASDPSGSGLYEQPVDSPSSLTVASSRSEADTRSANYPRSRTESSSGGGEGSAPPPNTTGTPNTEGPRVSRTPDVREIAHVGGLPDDAGRHTQPAARSHDRETGALPGGFGRAADSPGNDGQHADTHATGAPSVANEVAEALSPVSESEGNGVSADFPDPMAESNIVIRGDSSHIYSVFDGILGPEHSGGRPEDAPGTVPRARRRNPETSTDTGTPPRPLSEDEARAGKSGTSRRVVEEHLFALGPGSSRSVTEDAGGHGAVRLRADRLRSAEDHELPVWTEEPDTERALAGMGAEARHDGPTPTEPGRGRHENGRRTDAADGHGAVTVQRGGPDHLPPGPPQRDATGAGLTASGDHREAGNPSRQQEESGGRNTVPLLLPPEPARTLREEEIEGFPGFYIRWDRVADPTFLRTVREQLTTIASRPVGKKLLESISNSTTVVALPNWQGVKVKIQRIGGGTVIQENPAVDNPHAGNVTKFSNANLAIERGRGTVSAIYYNPNVWGTPDGLRPPFIGLAHELIHVQRNHYGLSQPKSRDDEAEVVGFRGSSGLEFTENKIRAEHGLMPRFTYTSVVSSEHDDSAFKPRTTDGYTKDPIRAGSSARMRHDPGIPKVGRRHLGGLRRQGALSRLGEGLDQAPGRSDTPADSASAVWRGDAAGESSDDTRRDDGPFHGADSGHHGSQFESTESLTGRRREITEFAKNDSTELKNKFTPLLCHEAVAYSLCHLDYVSREVYDNWKNGGGVTEAIGHDRPAVPHSKGRDESVLINTEDPEAYRLADIPAGHVVAAFRRNTEEGKLVFSHMMLSLGEGKVRGSNNQALLADSTWAVFDLNDKLSWSSDGRTAPRLNDPSNGRQKDWGLERHLFHVPVDVAVERMVAHKARMDKESALKDTGIVDEWLKISDLGCLKSRSVALKRLDTAVRTWKDNTRSLSVYPVENMTELTAIRREINAWRNSKGSSLESGARHVHVSRLERHVEAKLDQTEAAVGEQQKQGPRVDGGHEHSVDHSDSRSLANDNAHRTVSPEVALPGVDPWRQETAEPPTPGGVRLRALPLEQSGPGR